MSDVFAGIRTMFKSPIQDPSKKYKIFGVPYDTTSTYRSGSRFGPSAIREASTMLCDGQDWHSRVDVASLVSDFGDIDFKTDITEFTRTEGDVILLGGEHSVAYMGIKRAWFQNKCNPITVIHFDAHCDTWETDEVEHGSFLRHAIEDGYVKEVIQHGIRSPAPDSAKFYGSDIITIMDDTTCFDKIGVWNNTPAYITFDIDCIDPAFAPGTGTPESFGMTPKDALRLLQGYISNTSLNIVGFDIVEVNPSYDNSNITSILAANLVWKYISAMES